MFKAWREKRRKAQAENEARVIEVGEVTDDFEAPTFDTSWKIQDSDTKVVDSLVAEMQRTGAIQRDTPKIVHPDAKRQSVDEIGKIFQDASDSLSAEDHQDNNYARDDEADAQLSQRRQDLGAEAVSENPIFYGDADNDPYDLAEEGYFDEEDYYRYGPGGQTHGRNI